MPEERHAIAQTLVLQHLADQQARAEELNRLVGPRADSVPVLGDVLEIERPALPRNDAPGGLVPLQQPDAMKVRGYLDDEDNPTALGEEFLTLLDEGIFDETGKLTKKGEAFAMDPDEALKPDNWQAFARRDAFGLDDTPDASFGSILSATGGFLKDAIAGTAQWIGSDPIISKVRGESGTDEERARDTVAAQGFLEGAFESSAQLGAGLDRINDKLWMDPATPEGQLDAGYWQSKQEFKKFQRDMIDKSIAEYGGMLFGSDAMVERMEAAREQARASLAPEEFEKLDRQAQASGNLVGDPSNLAVMGVGAAVGGSTKIPMLTRMAAQADKAALARLAELEARTAMTGAQALAAKAVKAGDQAAKQVENLAAIGRDSPRLRNFADQMRARAIRETETAARLQPILAEKAADAAKLTKDARVAEYLTGMAAKGRELRAVPLKAFAEATERMGERIIRMDDGLREFATKYGMEGVGRVLSSPWTPAAVGFLTAGPVGAVVAAGGRALASGPVLKSIGNFSRVMGAELMQRRGTIPFFRRVANNSTLTPLGRATAHLMDFATLGGKALAPVRIAGQTAKGIAAAAPIDLAFEVVAAGGEIDGNTLKQGLAESIVFAGTGAAAGAMLRGNRRQLQQQQLGDEMNFRSGLVDREALAFGRMNSGARRTLSSYAAAFPALRFELTTDGPSSYDRTTNTARINTRQADWMAPIIAHEVSHYIQIKGQMEPGIKAMLVGDGLTGGLMRAADGTLNPDFKKFADAYNDRLVRQGINPLPIDDIAVEYFAEATAGDITTMVESGELAKLASRSNVERMAREMSRELIGRTPFVRDLAARLGTANDRGGRPVPGTGILADGVRTLPGAREMVRGMLRDQAGRRVDTVISEEASTIPIELVRGDRAMMDSLFSTLQTDAAGNATLDANGDPLIISRETDMRRMAAGLIVTELEAERIKNGRQLPEGEIAPQENGEWQGTHLSNEAIQKLADSGIFNAKQLAVFRMLNRAAKGMTGETFMMIYQPATIKRKGKRAAYGSLPATFREVVPVGVKITAAGNIIVETMSVTQLVENVRERAGSKRGKKLYNGDQVAIMEDIQNVLDLHRKGERTDGYFAQKYGSIDGPEYKNFINTTFGLMTPAQQGVNPVFAEDRVTDKGNVFKSRRLDRINQTTRMQGRPALPFGYDAVKLNYLPNGVPETNETP